MGGVEVKGGGGLSYIKVIQAVHTYFKPFNC